MTDEFAVLADELEAHTGKVDGLIDRMRTAVDAANTVTMNNEAYGVVCQPFALLLQPFEELGVSTLRQAADTLADAVKKVQSTTRSYTDTDTTHQATFTTMEGEL